MAKVKTLLDIDRELLEQAKNILAQPTLAATVTEALERVVRQYGHEHAVQMFAELPDEVRDRMGRARDEAW